MEKHGKSVKKHGKSQNRPGTTKESRNALPGWLFVFSEATLVRKKYNIGYLNIISTISLLFLLRENMEKTWKILPKHGKSQ